MPLFQPLYDTPLRYQDARVLFDFHISAAFTLRIHFRLRHD